MMRMTGRIGLWAVTCAVLLGIAGCGGDFKSDSGEGKVMLFNGRDFTGWERFVPNASVNVDDVWGVRGKVIYCAGKPHGYIRTKTNYKDYHLHLEWRWPEEPTNSGVLLHASGPDEVWPTCIEAQLMSGKAGDFVLMKGQGLTVDGVNHQDANKRYVVIPKKAESSEKTPGQWNSYDIHCKGDTITCYVNGVLQNEGTAATITTGWICLQSEGSPIEFRNIYILPAE